jgi:hypothetical protein
MAETAQSPEKTPYERSLDDFFRMLRNSAATQSSIRMTVAGILDNATSPTFDRQKYLDVWAERHEYDVDGILVDAGGPAEFDDDGQAYENDNDFILMRKMQLACDVTAFVVASEHSALSDPQKEHLLNRVNSFLENRREEVSDKSLVRGSYYMMGEAAAPYIALDVDRAEMGSDKPARLARGRFVLRALESRSFIRNDQRHTLSRTLRLAAKN